MRLSVRLKNNTFFIFSVVLVILNLGAHFLPFERASVAPDDYVYLVHSKDVKISDLGRSALKIKDRPFNYAVLMLQAKIIGDNSSRGLAVLFLSGIFLALAVFYLFTKLFKDIFTGFIGALIFSVLVNKLEIYHTPIFININTVIGIYVLCLAYFLGFLESRKRYLFFLSLFLYFTGIFWYEVGFFLPLILTGYCIIFRTKNSSWPLTGFFALMVLNIFFRLGSISGPSAAAQVFHSAGFAGPAHVLKEIFYNFGGRYVIRNIIYGIDQFFAIEPFWLALLLCFNFFFLYVLRKILKTHSLRIDDKRLLPFALVVLSVFLLPFFFNKDGGVGARHAVLPSLGLTVILIILLKLTREKWRIILSAFIAISLIISQGNAWAQVVACRLNNSVYQALKEQKAGLVSAGAIVVDASSFVEKIPFAWIKSDYNVLNTYYGAQAFEDRAFEAMARLVTGDKAKKVYVAISRPQLNEAGFWQMQISEAKGYRSVERKTVILPKAGTLIVDYPMVYPNGFNRGLR